MKKIIASLFAVLIFVSAYAQKLPNVQQVSLRAPANVKVDGKADDWGNKFQAYNTATDVFYTIANDDKKLYLILYVPAGTVVNRAAVGGIRLMVQTNGSKSPQGAVLIKYPFFEKNKLIVYPVKKVGEVNTPAEGDSIMKVYNQKIASNVKLIYTKGVADTDSTISIYNNKGIQAAGAFDQTRAYTCEMAIDLAALGLLADARQFSYNITINADPNKMSFPTIMGPIVSGTNADGSKMNEAQVAAANISFQNKNNLIYATTDFWGEYTLAK
ncbi:hypothetical protein [Mucilaginibacter auburnensis]|uniref:Uncharacterized protein n=1 Tax=Mucilaginibacter auburnensis TaxID=1457233 RepID=A0A2H9VUB7_9SPHI|nr:hypothetical protein [Mucilaginibacter auburnensis]PJJ84398.1 hypothetical protein CLV57_1409 [Mucilaginibacter auburnensis]